MRHEVLRSASIFPIKCEETWIENEVEEIDTYWGPLNVTLYYLFTVER